MYNEFSECLREGVLIWKKEVGASYYDIANIVKCSKSHLFEFLRCDKNINYELGKTLEWLIMWDIDTFAKYKAQMIIDKRKANSPEFKGEK